MPVLRANYLRVTHPYASTLTYCYIRILDLHVLSTPPAFVLSQDQTLREGMYDKRGQPHRGEPSVDTESRCLRSLIAGPYELCARLYQRNLVTVRGLLDEDCA